MALPGVQPANHVPSRTAMDSSASSLPTASIPCIVFRVYPFKFGLMVPQHAHLFVMVPFKLGLDNTLNASICILSSGKLRVSCCMECKRVMDHLANWKVQGSWSSQYHFCQPLARMMRYIELYSVNAKCFGWSSSLINDQSKNFTTSREICTPSHLHAILQHLTLFYLSHYQQSRGKVLLQYYEKCLMEGSL